MNEIIVASKRNWIDTIDLLNESFHMKTLSEQFEYLKEFGSERNRKFGKVFLVRDRLSQQEYVLKIINKTNQNQIAQERLKNETKFKFDFPGLPLPSEIVETTENLVLIKRYIRGVTLEEYWQTIPTRNRMTILHEILKELCPLLDHLKSSEVVHADIKPTNIIVHKTDKLELALIDFGMAIKINHVEHRNILFPIGYAAPELLLNHLDIVDHRTDLYALGISIWKLMDGKLPLFHPNPSIFTNLQLTHPLPESSAMNRKLTKILQKLCYKHSFRTSPNRMKSKEVRENLKSGMNGRYNNLTDFLSDFEQLLPTKKWYQFF